MIAALKKNLLSQTTLAVITVVALALVACVNTKITVLIDDLETVLKTKKQGVAQATLTIPVQTCEKKDTEGMVSLMKPRFVGFKETCDKDQSVLKAQVQLPIHLAAKKPKAKGKVKSLLSIGLEAKKGAKKEASLVVDKKVFKAMDKEYYDKNFQHLDLAKWTLELSVNSKKKARDIFVAGALVDGKASVDEAKYKVKPNTSVEVKASDVYMAVLDQKGSVRLLRW